jgi:Fe2+ transport system protein FeoA
LKPLHELRSGEKAFIVDLRNPRLSEKLFELGIYPGALIEVKEHREEANYMLIHVNRKDYNIFKHAASTIITNNVSLEFELN